MRIFRNFILNVTLIFLCSCIYTKNSNVVTLSSFSYMSYFTSDIIVNGNDFGMGAGGLFIDSYLEPGAYYVYWTDAGTGKQFKSVNQIIIPNQINKEYAVVHIYPNNQAEIIFTNAFPEKTVKGFEFEKIYKKPKIVLQEPKL